MIEASQTLAPLRGIVHAAGVLDDGILLQQTVERFETVMAPKAQGSWHLHRQSEELPLDFFVCFSSVASLWGNGGQGNYAAANAFLDGLAHHRQALGLPALSINWGAWAEVGLAAEFARRAGIQSIPPEQGVQLLGALMEQETPQVGVAPVAWNKFRQQLPAEREFPLLSEMLKVTLRKRASSLMQQLEKASISDRYGILKAHVRNEVLQVIGIEPQDQQGFSDVGMDSLMSIQLSNRLAASLAVSLPATLTLEYPTVERLTDHLAKAVLGWESSADTESPSDTTTTLLEIEELSEDKVELSIAEELAELEAVLRRKK
jgi:acyl carrier protein